MSASGPTALAPTAKGGGYSSNMGEASDTSPLGWLRDLTKGTVVSSIFILLTTCIGAGTLSLPYAFAKGGILIFSIVFFIIMLLSIYVGLMLLYSKDCCTEVYPDLEVWSYEDLAYASFGYIGRILSLLTIAVLLFLGLTAYMIYTRDQLTAVMHFIVEKRHLSECSLLLNCGILMMMAFFPIFPVTLLRKLTPLQFTSYLSIFSISLVALFITIKTILVNSGHAHDNVPEDRHVYVAPQSASDIITVFSYCGLSFICHFNLLPLQKELKNATKVKMYFVVAGSMLLAYSIYNIVVFSAYFNFYNTIMSDVMLNYDQNDVLMTVARVFLFFTIMFHYPVLLHPTRSNINGALYLIYKVVTVKLGLAGGRNQIQEEEKQPILENGNKKDNFLELKVPTILWFLETCILFCLTFMAATFITDVGKVWNFVGSTAGVLVLYIYPAAFFLRLRYVRRKKRAVYHNTTMSAQCEPKDYLMEGVAGFMLVLGAVLFVVQNYDAVKAVLPQSASNTTNSSAPTCFIVPSDCTSDHQNSSLLYMLETF